MHIVFMTPDEPFYLPDFYKHIIENLASGHTLRVVIVPPIYKKTTVFDLAVRYARTFGVKEAALLSSKVITFKVLDTLSRGAGTKHYSLKSLFTRYGIRFSYETDVNSVPSLNRLKEWGTELIISISCPQIFKKELIDLPPRGCLNLHGSLLPEYRGVMPSFWVLANGEREAGSTLFYVNEAIDAGDVLVQKRFSISFDDTLDSFIRRSKRIGAEMVIEAINKIQSGRFETRPLDMSKGSYFGWPSRQDVERFVKAGRRFR